MTTTTFFGENLTPAGAVSGAPLTQRNLFVANLVSGVVANGFEQSPDGVFAADGFPVYIALTGSAGLITATPSVSVAGTCVVKTASESGRFNTTTGGSQYLRQRAQANLTLVFSTPVAFFGFYGTDIGDFLGTRPSP